MQSVGGVVGGFRNERHEFPPGGFVLCLLSPVMGHEFFHVEVVFARQRLAVAMYFTNDFVGMHNSSFHEFRRCADDRARKAAPTTNSFDPTFKIRVVEMSAIPGEQKVHPMDRSERQMNGVHGGDFRENPLAKQAFNQDIGLRAGAKLRQSGDYGETLGSKIGIALSDFFQHGFGYEKIECMPPHFPPFLRGFMIRRQPQVPTAPRHEVTGDGGFEIETRIHGGTGEVKPRSTLMANQFPATKNDPKRLLHAGDRLPNTNRRYDASPPCGCCFQTQTQISRRAKERPQAC